MNLNDNRPIIEKSPYDVVVVGGGIGGIAAAVSASRHGAKTILLEKQINLGGLGTVGLISWYEPLCDGVGGEKMVTGIGEELIRLAVKYGFENLPEKWGGAGKNVRDDERYSTYYSPMIFSLALDEYVRDSGADIRFDTLAAYPVMEGNVCTGIMAETVSGREFYPAKIVIDATGDASICHRAGLPTAEGTNVLTYVSHRLSKDELKVYDAEKDLMELRKWDWISAKDVPEDKRPEYINKFTGTTSDKVNEFIYLCKKALFDKVCAQNKNDRELLSIPTMPQFRTIRHIVGEYTFDGSEDGSKFEDSMGCFTDFRKPNTHYQLPYRTLYNASFPNIIAAGRIISVEGDGWEATRVIPVCALSGQVAGTASAYCIKNGTYLNNIDVSALKQILAADGVKQDFDA